MQSIFLRRFLVRKGTVRLFYEQPPSKQIFSRETADSEQWLAKYLIVGASVGLFLFSLSSVSRETEFEPPYPERTRSRLMQTYGFFSAGLLMTGAVGMWANKRLAQSIITNPLYAKYFCGGGAAFTALSSGLVLSGTMGSMASYPIWLLIHAGLGCLAPAYSLVLGPFFYESCIFFGISLTALGMGAISSFTENDSFEPNRISPTWTGGTALAGLVGYIMYPKMLYMYHYVFLLYFSFIYTKDSTRTLQEVKSTSPKTFSPATSALRIHYESWNRARRGIVKLFKYSASQY